MTNRILLVFMLIGGVTGIAGAEPADAMPRPSPFDAKGDRDGVHLQVLPGDKRVVLDISGSGIGGATVRRMGDHWPQTLVLKIHLHGLEFLSLSSGRRQLHASVLSGGDHPPLLSLWEDGKEGPPLEKRSPYWMDIRSLDADGKLVDGLPPENGWFEMMIPAALFTDEQKTLELAWIDFFRN